MGLAEALDAMIEENKPLMFNMGDRQTKIGQKQEIPNVSNHLGSSIVTKGERQWAMDHINNECFSSNKPAETLTNIMDEIREQVTYKVFANSYPAATPYFLPQGAEKKTCTQDLYALREGYACFL
jgi:hypothetical protein